MALKLPRLPVGWQTIPQLFERYWDEAMTKLEQNSDRQDSVINNIRRILSHTDPTSIMTATEDKIVISNHVRVFGDGTTLSITGATFPSLTPSTAYYFYYDDSTFTNTNPTIQITTDASTAQAVSGPNRYFLGVIRTPSTGSSESRLGGGVYAAGSNVGGEI